MSYSSLHIKESLKHSFKGFALAKGFEFLQKDDIFLFKSSIPNPVFNYAYVEGKLPVWVEKYFGTCPFLVIGEQSDEILQKSLVDFTLEEDDVLGMVCELQGIEDIPNVEVVCVETPDRLPHLIDVISQGFEVPKSHLADFLTPLFPLKDQYFFLAYLDGEPASACLSSIAGDSMFLSFVATKPNLRRRGAGKSVSLAALLDARDCGCKICALQSSKMAEGV